MGSPDTSNATKASKQQAELSRERFERYGPLDELLANNLTQILETGELDALLGQRGVIAEQSAEAGSNAMRQTEAQVARTRTGGTPYDVAVRSQARETGALAGARANAALDEDFFNQVASIIQYQAGIAESQGTNAAAGLARTAQAQQAAALSRNTQIGGGVGTAAGAAIGGIIGAVGGFGFGAPAGAAAGGAIGGAIGTGAGYAAS